MERHLPLSLATAGLLLVLSGVVLGQGVGVVSVYLCDALLLSMGRVG